MLRFDASSAECLVFTHKEGLLSAIAHDLKIRVTKFVIEVDDTARSVTAHFDARSLRVACAMEGDADAPDTLSQADKRQIEANIVNDVLDARAHPEISFASSAATEEGDQITVKGTLTICGHGRRLTIRARQQGDRYVAEVRLHQPDFGIRPYSAMLGTLRVQPDVLVRITLPAKEKFTTKSTKTTKGNG